MAIRRTIAIIISVALCFSVCACGNNSSDSPSDSIISAQTTTTEKNNDATTSRDTLASKSTTSNPSTAKTSASFKPSEASNITTTTETSPSPSSSTAARFDFFAPDIKRMSFHFSWAEVGTVVDYLRDEFCITADGSLYESSGYQNEKFSTTNKHYRKIDCPFRLKCFSGADYTAAVTEDNQIVRFNVYSDGTFTYNTIKPEDEIDYMSTDNNRVLLHEDNKTTEIYAFPEGEIIEYVRHPITKTNKGWYFLSSNPTQYVDVSSYDVTKLQLDSSIVYCTMSMGGQDLVLIDNSGNVYWRGVAY